jgi:glutamine synthetase
MTSWTDTETGPGVFETALAYTSALRMADNALLFKYLVKSLGMKYGITPSFMAKPWGNVCISFAAEMPFFTHYGPLLAAWV